MTWTSAEVIADWCASLNSQGDVTMWLTQRRHTAAQISPSNHEESGLSHQHPAGEVPSRDAIIRACLVPEA